MTNVEYIKKSLTHCSGCRDKYSKTISAKVEHEKWCKFDLVDELEESTTGDGFVILYGKDGYFELDDNGRLVGFCDREKG